MTTLVELPIHDIIKPEIRQPLTEVRVVELADSIDRLGLLQPLVVVPWQRRFRLVAGRHRLEAVTRLQWPTVPCVVLNLDSVQRELAEVDENLIRRSLNYLDRAELLARRVELLNALGHQRRGRPRKAAPGAGYSTTLPSLASGFVGGFVTGDIDRVAVRTARTRLRAERKARLAAGTLLS